MERKNHLVFMLFGAKERRAKMTKKRVAIFTIIILIVGLLLYFKPLKLSHLINENQHILISYDEIAIHSGAPYINTTNYNEITENEKQKIIGLLNQYSYKRTFGTILSDGSLSGLGDEIVYIFIYNENNKLVNRLCISSSDQISVNEKAYTLKKSSVLIASILEILNK